MDQASPQQSEPLARPVRVGFALNPSDPFWVQVREAAKQHAQELGIDLIRLPALPATTPGEAFIAFLEDLRASEVHALISHVLPRAALLTILDDGLPIICSEETTLTHPLLVSVRGLEQAAELAAASLMARMGGEGRLLLVGGIEENLETARTRIQGFRTVAAQYPRLLYAHVPTMWRYDEVYEHLIDEEEELRSLFPEGRVDAIFGLSDPTALAARDALRSLRLADDFTLVAGINGDPLAIAAIEAGSMHATVETDPQDLGSRLVEYAYLAARSQPLPSHFAYRLQLVTAENVSQVAARRLVAIAELPSRLVDVNRMQEEERLRQLRASIEMNRRLGEFLAWNDLSRALTEVIRTRYGYDRVQLYRWAAEDQCLFLAEGAATGIRDPARISVADAGVLAETLLRNRATYVPDTHTSRRYRPDPEWPETRARVVLPVRFGGKTLGVLDLHSYQRTVRTQPELDALQMLADQLGGAIQNALLYEAALESRAEAEESNRARARLFANLSHGLRTPLNAILGHSQSALAEPNPYGMPLPRALAQDIRLIQQSGADLLRLVNDLLDLAQAESGSLRLHPEWIDSGTMETPNIASAPFRPGSDRASILVKRGVAFIDSHYASSFGRDELAEELGVSAAYVSRLFKRELGLSPWDYLTRIRIENARRLLLDREPRTVAQIAAQVGFADPAYFTRIFRRATGKSPQAFRAHARVPQPSPSAVTSEASLGPAS